MTENGSNSRNIDEQDELEDFGGDGIDYNPRFSEPLEFKSIDVAYDWAKSIAHDIGFGLTKSSCKRRRDNIDYKVTCERGGKYYGVLRDPEKVIRKNTTTKKCECPFTIRIVSNDGGKKFAVIPAKGKGFHNHKLYNYFDGHRQMTQMNMSKKQYVEDQVRAHVSIKQIKHGFKQMFPSKALPISRQLYNLARKIRFNERQGRNRAEQMFHLASINGYTTFHDKNPATDKLSRVMMCHPNSLRLLKSYYFVAGIDSTYKTNMSTMALVQLVGFTPVGVTFLIGYAIISDEKTASYVWILEKLQELLGHNVVLNAFITDRELGLMSALQRVFPTSHHILCLWHVNRVVENKAKELTKNGVIGLSFLKRWNRLVACETEVELDIFLEGLSTYKYKNLIAYLEDTWYVHMMKFVKCYTNEVLHYGMLTTGFVESAHSILKRWIGTSTLGLDTLWQKLDALIDGQHREIGAKLEASRNRHTHDYYSGLFTLLRGFVSIHCVRLLEDEFQRGVDLGDKLVDKCGCAYITTHGIPCASMLYEFHRNKMKVHPDHCDAFWRTLDYQDDGSTELNDLALFDYMFSEARKQHHSVRRKVIDAVHVILNPGEDNVKELEIKENPKGRPRNSTTRNKSRFEHLRRKYPIPNQPPKDKASSPSQPQVLKPWSGNLTRGTVDIFPWCDILPDIFGEYLIGWYAPIADGHCGFRVLAHAVHHDEGRWKYMRLTLLGEIRHQIYEFTYGRDELVSGRVRDRIGFLIDGVGCSDQHWMNAQDCVGFTTMLNKVIVVVHFWHNVATDNYHDLSATYLPLRAEPGVASPTGIMWVMNVGNHWVRLFLDDDVPLPPITTYWTRHDRTVNGWDAYYRSRIDRWTRHRSDRGGGRL